MSGHLTPLVALAVAVVGCVSTAAQPHETWCTAACVAPGVPDDIKAAVLAAGASLTPASMTSVQVQP
jgi:hypothetical protein